MMGFCYGTKVPLKRKRAALKAKFTWMMDINMNRMQGKNGRIKGSVNTFIAVHSFYVAEQALFKGS